MRAVKFELTQDNRGVPDEVLLEDLRCVARLLNTGSVPREKYNNRGRFHAGTLINRFGSWTQALERAGLRIHKYNNLKKEDCLADLKRVATKLNKKVVSVIEYRQFGRYAETPFRRLFGSWANALSEAGLHVSDNYREPKSIDELHQNLEAVWRAIGRQPRRSDMRIPVSLVGYDTYRRRFGSWRKALEAFVAYISDATNQVSDTSVQREDSRPSCEHSPKITDGTTPRTGRNVSWRLRFLVMRNDGFKCRLCGMSPAITPSTVLVIDHIVPWSKGGETLFNNLQTLCGVCNGGKSNLSIHQ